MTRQLAIVEKGRESSVMIDPADPGGGHVRMAGSLANPHTGLGLRSQGGELRSWPGADRVPEAPAQHRDHRRREHDRGGRDGDRVAYGFSRFRFPGPGPALPDPARHDHAQLAGHVGPDLHPFHADRLDGDLASLIVPHFFANAYNVFLLRQYFLTIPRDLDEAAMIDGAGPFRILRSVIVPQAIPAIVAVTPFHFFFAWNEFLLSLVYVGGNPDLWPLLSCTEKFASLYVTRPPLVQASAILAIAVPVVVFFLSQRAFMRGVVVTGVDK